MDLPNRLVAAHKPPQITPSPRPARQFLWPSGHALSCNRKTVGQGCGFFAEKDPQNRGDKLCKTKRRFTQLTNTTPQAFLPSSRLILKIFSFF
jgi:hypothetical protein